MKKPGYCLLFLGMLCANAPAFAENRAVEIDINGMGPGVDAAAFQTVRQTVGYAVASGVIDTFVVYGYGREGGFSACAQARQGQAAGLGALARQLRSIRPNASTTAYSVRLAASCSPAPVYCTQEVKQCPDGSYVGRQPPACQFAACPAN